MNYTLTLLLSSCIGFINVGRGRGKDSFFHFAMKEFTVLSMIASCYILTKSWIAATLFPLPLCYSWWVKGGTGGYMPYFVKYFEWMYWEFIFAFSYSILMLTTLQLIINN